MRKYVTAGALVVAIAGTLGLLAMARGNQHEKDGLATTVRSPDAAPPDAAPSAPVIPGQTLRGHSSSGNPGGLPKGHLTEDGKPVPQFIDASKMPEWRAQELAKYQAFVSKAGLTKTQEEALRQAVADATLTFYLGLEYVKGEHSGVRSQDVSDSADEDIKRGLEGMTESQKAAFMHEFGYGDTLYVSKLFDVDPLVKELLPHDEEPPTEPSPVPSPPR